jgi:hypothetical protein
MTETELSHAILEGIVQNTISDFYHAAIKKTGKKRGCPTAYREAWKMYVEAMKDYKLPVKL